MFEIDLLLSPIRPDAPAGDDLRYDAVYDQIAEARAEDDATLPMGDWARPPRRADLPQVLALTSEALARRSKDLWLAAWLGHAQMKTEGIAGLPVALRLLTELQERFWETLHPELEDGDAGARSAPLQWAFEQFATLLLEMPSVAPGWSLQEYRLKRLSPETRDRDEVEAALTGTSKAFLEEAEAVLGEAGRELLRMQVFCDAHFGEDGPSFVKVRRSAEEVLNTVATLLRARRELEPDVVVEEATAEEMPEPVVESAAGEVAAEELEPEVAAAVILEADREPATEKPAEREPAAQENARTEPGLAEAERAVVWGGAPRSREEAIGQIEAAALFLARSAPKDPTGYAVLAARQWARVWEMPEDGGDAPPSEMRREMRTLRREERWAELLETAVTALASGGAERWLDLHHDVWMAAERMGAESLAASAAEVARLLLAFGTVVESSFDDETAVASEATRAWITREVLRDEAEEQPGADSGVKAPAERGVKDAEANVATRDDLAARATAMTRGGDVAGAVGLLMADAEQSAARRKGFFRRLEAARMCVMAGCHAVAQRLLERLLAEIAEFGVEVWEGSQVSAEVLFLLLQCPGADDGPEAPGARLARLCAVDPVRALELQAGR